jgi:hypothetical protein
MAKHHGGTDHIQGRLSRGTQARPNAVHGGSGRPHGITHGPPQPRIQGGTFGMGTLKKGQRK